MKTSAMIRYLRFTGIFLMLFCAFIPFPAHASGDPYITVTYDTPHCGTPMTFTLTVVNGSNAEYKYRFSTITDGEWGLVDMGISQESGISSGKPVTSNALSFTFYASGTYTVRFQATDPTAPSLYIRSDPIQFTISDPNYPTMSQKIADLTRECSRVCTTEFDKALWMHDYLIEHADYDYSLTYCNAEGVLFRGKGTCESYSRAYSKLLNAVGIENVKLTGKDHTWNIVKIDGAWYQIDPTWDDPSSNAPDWKYHLYFGLTDELTKIPHSYYTPQTGYECTSYDCNYYIRTGEISKWIDPLLPLIRQNLDAGTPEFTIPIDSTNTPSGFWYSDERSCSIVYNLASWSMNRSEWKTSAGDPVLMTVEYLTGRQLHFTVQIDTFTLPASVQQIDAEAFNGTNIRSVIIPSGCAAIGSKAFGNCPYLNRIEIPASVTSIADDAFSGSSNVTIVTVDGSAAHRFAEAHSLTVLLQ